MENKTKIKDSKKAKIIYIAVVSVLCISAIVIGLVAANSRKTPSVDPDVPGNDSGLNDDGGNSGNENEDDGNKDGNANVVPTFISPAVGTVQENHSIEVPVFSETLNEWRYHTGIDIATAENAEVYAAADGTVSRIYEDPLLGNCVEIKHSGDAVTIYCNLSSERPEGLTEGAAVKSGDLIGKVGDSAISEIAAEPHLHFEIKISGAYVDPLEHISEDSKSASLNFEDIYEG